ncbi:MAG: MBL fold metallo-hydrolase [Rhodocyclales bacterium]|nr:MBL fold metallo-hydrolase [Rhodocyclales bacterium]
MPLPFALNHVNLWLLDDGDAAVVVDTGFGLDEVRAHWSDILSRDGRPLSGIIATHCHPDHLGLAAWLAERDQAPIHMTQGEFLVAHAMWHQQPGYSIPDMLKLFTTHGLDTHRLTALEQRGNGYKRGVPALPDSYHRMFDGDVLRIGGREWRVIVGYGHAPEHASLYCEALGILISGDMLLPRISTNVSVFAATPHDDPLGLFLASLQRIKHLPDSTLVLPSHGNPFRGLGLRIAQLEAHHAERCELLLSTLDVPRNAGEMLATLFTRELDTHQVLFAMGETVAHLNYLANRGQVARQVADDGTVKFERTA